MSECLYRDIKYEDILSNGWVNRIETFEKAFTIRFVLGTSKLRKLLSVVMNLATVDAPGYVYSYPPWFVGRIVSIYNVVTAFVGE